MSQGAGDLGAQLLSAVGKLNRWATKHSDLPIPTAQARLLGLVEAHNGSRIGELASADHCSQPTMTAQVKKLEEQGLLTRSTDEDDARASRISLTEQGVAMLAQVRAARSSAITPVLEALTPQDRDVLRRANELLRQIAAER